MIAIEIDARQLAQLTKATENARKSLPRELSAAINEAAKRTNLGIQRQITKKTTVKAAAARKQIKIVKRSSPATLSAHVSLKPSRRIPLRDFAASQKKSGVSYRIEKGGKKATVLGAFQGPKPGAVNTKWRGRVFKRVGQARLPIVQLFGPSPWGVFVKNKMSPAQVKDIEAELKYQIERRINKNVLQANGIIPG
jgi:hypothetical protein